MSLTFILLTVSIFVLTVIAERILIPILRAHKMGQTILEIGPFWHKSKEGTPTMGGLGFILSTLVVMVAFFVIKAMEGTASQYIPLCMTLGFAVANGAIGFVDDYCKLVKKQNEGLTWKQKIFLQLVMSAAYVVVMSYTGYLTPFVRLPFMTYTVNFGWAVYPLAVIVLTGIVNGSNLTDGIDGLESSISFVIGAFYSVYAVVNGNEQLLVVGAVLVGLNLGFLIFNFHPAQVFMGDTGSLFLGGLVIAGAFQMQESVLGIVVSMVFILEMLSSLIQIVYFRATGGKRLFKMAPIHHHFEQCGWSENKIVLVFSAVELLFCVLAGLI